MFYLQYLVNTASAPICGKPNPQAQSSRKQRRCPTLQSQPSNRYKNPPFPHPPDDQPKDEHTAQAFCQHVPVFAEDVKNALSDVDF